MANLLAISQLIGTLVPQLLSLITQAIQAHQAGDQAALDAIHYKAVAAANALAPTA